MGARRVTASVQGGSVLPVRRQILYVSHKGRIIVRDWGLLVYER